MLRHHIDPLWCSKLLQLWNAARCRPPLPEEDIERIVNSIAGKELRRRGRWRSITSSACRARGAARRLAARVHQGRDRQAAAGAGQRADRAARAWPDAFAFDEMLRAPVLMQALADEPDFVPRPVTDVDVGIVQDRLQHLGLKRLSQGRRASGRRRARARMPLSPGADYLDGLQWDGTPRLAKLLADYFGAETRPTRRPSAQCF